MSKNKTKRKPQQNQEEESPKLAFSTKGVISKIVVFVIIAALILSVAATFFSTSQTVAI